MKILLIFPMLLIAIASASVTTIDIKPIIASNCATNTITISLPQQYNITMGYGDTLVFVDYNQTIVNLCNSPTNITSPSRTFTVTSPRNNTPSAQTYNSTIGNASVTINNVHINNPKPINATGTYLFNLTNASAFSHQFYIESNVLFNLHIEPQWKLNQIVIPSWYNSISLTNNLTGTHITVSAIPKLNQSYNITGANTIINSTTGITIESHYYRYDINETLPFGADYSNPSANILIRGATFTNSSFTYNDLAQLAVMLGLTNATCGVPLTRNLTLSEVMSCNSDYITKLYNNNASAQQQVRYDGALIANDMEQITTLQSDTNGIWISVALAVVVILYLAVSNMRQSARIAREINETRGRK